MTIFRGGQNAIDSIIIGDFVVDQVTFSPNVEYCDIGELTEIQCDGDEIVFAKCAATTAKPQSIFYILNSSADNTSHAKLKAIAAAGNTSDVFVGSGGTGIFGVDISFGIDNSATGDPFQFGLDTPGLKVVMNFALTGEVLQQHKPAFLSRSTTSQTDKTGNGTAYNILTAGSTEVFDLSGSLSGSTFTAPVTGKYLLTAQVLLYGFADANKGLFQIITSAETYDLMQSEITTLSDGTYYAMYGSVLVDMTAGDTATATITCWGEAADTVDVYGHATTHATYFSGYLAC